MSRLSSKPAHPILCYVTDRRNLPASLSNPAASVPSPWAEHQSLLQTIEAAARTGVDWIQLREKDISAGAHAALTREALLRVQNVSASHAQPTRIMVNDRLDVAFAERAGGVHLGENSLPVGDVKRLLRDSSAAQMLSKDFFVGVSCHSLDAAISAANSGADYIFFGPVFATPSKAGYGPPQGIDRLAVVCRSISIPVVAIGGITLENAVSCLTAGAAGIAAIRLFQDTKDVADIVQALRADLRANSL